jgi:hypothetical protein
LLRDATAELYSSDPDTFVERRNALTAQARAAGQPAAAKQIAALRRPTRSAWVVNRLVRAAPEVPGELASLGGELLAAQRSLDGPAIRELSQRRRQLIETLVRRAFTVTGQHDAPAALRDEVAATLGAALADPQVAAQLADATLTRVAHAEGFGPAGPPALSVLPGGKPERARPPAQARPPAKARQTAQERAEATARAKAEAQAQADAERERRRQETVAEAERAVTEADQAAQTATAAEQEQEDLVERLEVRLADAREALAKTRSAARRARNRQHQARGALARLRP